MQPKQLSLPMFNLSSPSKEPLTHSQSQYYLLIISIKNTIQNTLNEKKTKKKRKKIKKKLALLFFLVFLHSKNLKKK